MKTRALIMAFLMAGGAAAAWAAETGAAHSGEALALGKDAKIRSFRVPNYDDQGVMTSQIFGDFAQVLPDGNVEITGLRMEFYALDGENRTTNMTVTSPLCFYNPKRSMAVSDSDVRISRDEFVVTGKGFAFNNEKQELRILSDSKVVVVGAQKEVKSKESKREP